MSRDADEPGHGGDDEPATIPTDAARRKRNGGASAQRRKRANAEPAASPEENRPRREPARKRRIGLMFDDELIRRMDVHHSLSDESPADLLARLAMRWLLRYGKGRESFPPAPPALADEPAEDDADAA